MSFSQAERLSIAEKLAFQITGTSNAPSGEKYWYNESNSWEPQFKNPNIPVAPDTATADANVIAHPEYIEKLTIRLTLDTTSNNRSWMARHVYGDQTSDIYTNWIQPSLYPVSGSVSAGYGVRLYNGDPNAGGTPISTTYLSGSSGEPSWTWFYNSGIFVCSTDTSSNYSSMDLWVVAYRDLQPIIGGGGTGGGGYGLTFTDLDLVSGILTVTHDLEAENNVVHISVRDDNNYNVFPDSINYIGTNVVELDFNAFSPIPNTWALTVGFGGSGGSEEPVVVDPLRVEGDSADPLTGPFTWLANTVSGLPTDHIITTGDTVDLSFVASATLWVNAELSENAGTDFIAIPIAGNITDDIVTGQEFVVTGSAADGNTYSLGTTIMLNGAAIPGFHIADIILVSGTPVVLPTYPATLVPTAIDRPGGSGPVTIKTIVTGFTTTTLEVEESRNTSTTVDTIDIYRAHYINDGNFGLGKTNPLYKLDVAGDINAKTIFTDNLTTRLTSNISVPKGSLVFFGNAEDGSTELSDTYFKGFNENDTGFGDLTTDEIRNTVNVFGSETSISLITPSGNSQLLAFDINNTGLTLGTQFDTGVSTTSESLVFPLMYNSNEDNYTIRSREKFVGICDIDRNSSGELYLGFYEVLPDRSVSETVALYDTGIVLGAGYALREVVPIKHKIVSNVNIRFFVIRYVNNGSTDTLIRLCSYDVSTNAVIIGGEISLGLNLDFNTNMYAHYRVSPNSFYILYQTDKGINITNIGIDDTTYNPTGPQLHYVFGNPVGLVVYFEADDTHIGTASHDIDVVQTSPGTTTLYRGHVNSGSVEIMQYNVSDKDAYYHGITFWNAKRMGLTSKVALFGHHSDVAVGILDLKTKTFKTPGLFGSWDFMSEGESKIKVVAFTDGILYVDRYDDYDYIKFYDSTVALCTDNSATGELDVMFRGLYDAGSNIYEPGTTLSLGTSSSGLGGTKLDFSTEYSCGIELATVISSSKILFNPNINSVTGVFLESSPETEHAVMQDLKTSSSDGGDFNSGSWVTRDLNTINGNMGITLSSNTFFLTNGIYLITASATAFAVDSHQIRLVNASVSKEHLGTMAYASSADSGASESTLSATMTVSVPEAFHIEHRCETTRLVDGRGVGSSWGNNIFTNVTITRMK